MTYHLQDNPLRRVPFGFDPNMKNRLSPLPCPSPNRRGEKLLNFFFARQDLSIGLKDLTESLGENPRLNCRAVEG